MLFLFLGIAGCEAKAEINKPAIVEVELIGDRSTVIEGAYLFRFQRKGKDPKKPDTFNIGRSVQKLFLKDWNVQAPPELKVEKKEATVSLAEAGAYELKPSLTIAATPETASQYFKQSIAVEFPSVVGIANLLEASLPVCPKKVSSSSDRSSEAFITPISSPTSTSTETYSPSPTSTSTETASPSPTTEPQASAVNVNPDRATKQENVPACVPTVEFQITHYSSYSQLGVNNIGKNVLGIVGCALFVALMVWFLSDKWDIVFESILYVAAAVGLYAVGLLGIPFFLFQTLKNIGWILSGFIGG